MTVDDQKRPVLIIAWCSKKPTYVVIDKQVPGNKLSEVAELTPPYLEGKSARVHLDRPDDGWTLTRGTLEYDQGSTYRITVGNEPEQQTFGYVNYKPYATKGLSQNSVLIQRYDEKSDSEVDSVISTDEFVSQAQQSCSP